MRGFLFDFSLKHDILVKDAVLLSFQNSEDAAMIPVIIIQTASSAYQDVRTSLRDGGLIEGTDYKLFNHPKEAKEFLLPEGEQLLITGTFLGQPDDAAKFIEDQKRINPLLRAESFSNVEVGGYPYDHVIKRGRGWDVYKEIVERVREFAWSRGD